MKSKLSKKNVLATGFNLNEITEPDEVNENIREVEVPLEVECVESDSDSNSTDYGVSHAEDMIK